MLARRFLWVVAGITILVALGALAYRLFEPQLMKFALIPTVHFEGAAPADERAYQRAEMWIARPDIANNASLWTPAGVKRDGEKKALLFFIHPTSYLQRSRWNAPLDNVEANDRAALFLRGQASAFNAQPWVVVQAERL